VGLERGLDLRNLLRVLPDRHVDADDAGLFLIDDRVDGDRSLAGLAVADDELALTPTDGDHCVDRLEAGLQRRVDVLALDDTRSDTLRREALRCLDRAAIVELLTERVDHPADELVADGHLGDPAGGPNRVSFLEVLVWAEDDRAHAILAEVECEREHGALASGPGQFEQLARHGVLEAVDARDPVAHRRDHTFVGVDNGGFEARDALLEESLRSRRCVWPSVRRSSLSIRQGLPGAVAGGCAGCRR